MKEIWKDIEGYQDKYQVSNLGRVKSLTRKSWNGYKWWAQKGRLLKQMAQTNGYLYVDLCDGQSNAHRFRVHRLAAQAFIPNPNNYPQVNHKDENRQNNKAENLEWCTAKYNAQYGHHINRLSSIKSKEKYVKIAHQNGRKASKPVEQLTLENTHIQFFDSQLDAEKYTGVSHTGISNCCLGKNKSAGNYKWKFIDKELIGYGY